MALSRESFDYIRALLRERSGHVLDDDKAYLVESRLLAIARRHGLESLEHLALRLRSGSNEALECEIVEAMTVNETMFFRDPGAFDALRQTVIPQLITRRAAARSLNVWCAACASGQEAYSVAILLRHDFPSLASWKVRVLASDLSTAMLQRTRQGRYNEFEAARGLPAELLQACFDRVEGGWQIQDDLRRMLDVRQINLSEAWPILPPCDLVLLRNVLIYFDAANRKQILDRMRDVLRPDGYLMLGGAESTFNLTDAFVPVSLNETSFFRLRPSAVAVERPS